MEKISHEVLDIYEAEQNKKRQQAKLERKRKDSDQKKTPNSVGTPNTPSSTSAKSPHTPSPNINVEPNMKPQKTETPPVEEKKSIEVPKIDFNAVEKLKRETAVNSNIPAKKMKASDALFGENIQSNIRFFYQMVEYFLSWLTCYMRQDN